MRPRGLALDLVAIRALDARTGLLDGSGMSSDRPEPVMRLATMADAPAVDALMKMSIRALFPAFYTPEQTAASEVHIGHVDRMLIEDGTYLVLDAPGDGIVAWGGGGRPRQRVSWGPNHGRRARLLDPETEPARIRAMFVRADWTRRGLGTRILDACRDAARAEGFTTLSLMATLPGLQLYERYGFRATSRGPITLPDGTLVDCAAMEMPIGQWRGPDDRRAPPEWTGRPRSGSTRAG
jgi:GNAT superfamily N-acetyltransferase